MNHTLTRVTSQTDARAIEHATIKTLATGKKVVRVSGPVRNPIPKIGRNSACPCGSGKKYKRCHMGREDAE